MTRNTLRRVEVAAPVLDAQLRRRLTDMFQTRLRDNRQARELQPSGEYVRVRNQEKTVNAQELFYRQAYAQAPAEQPAAVPAVSGQEVPAPAPAAARKRYFESWLHNAMDKLKKQ